MNVAISGDRSSCLTQELAHDRYLFALARGFGSIDGAPIAQAVLARLRAQFEARPRRRAANLDRALANVNADVHARSASHEDYITAGCSITGVLLTANRAYLAHVGSTAAYLVRDGSVVSLTKHDAFESGSLPVLMRSLGSAREIDVAMSSFVLNEGDVLVLSGRRIERADERSLLAGSLARGAPGASGEGQLLVVRYESASSPQGQAMTQGHTVGRICTGVVATFMFYALLCIR